MSGKTSSKAQLRGEIRRSLAQLSRPQITDYSANLRRQLVFPPGSKVALFAGTPTEPSLLDLISQETATEWYLPKVLAPGEMDFLAVESINSLQIGAFGIREPTSGAIAQSLDYLVCPGLAFTLDGKRLGQGGGFYDRVLPRFPDAKVLGVAFPCQIFADLPTEQHDRRMDRVFIPELAK